MANKNKKYIIKLILSGTAFAAFGLITLAFYGIADAHGHGITSGDRNFMFALLIFAVFFLILFLYYLKKMIFPGQ